VVTIERGTNTVLAIRRNWEEDDPRKAKRQHFVQYTYIPGFGAYGLGYIHIIGGYARAGPRSSDNSLTRARCRTSLVG
jgi:hypothetical protein